MQFQFFCEQLQVVSTRKQVCVVNNAGGDDYRLAARYARTYLSRHQDENVLFCSPQPLEYYGSLISSASYLPQDRVVYERVQTLDDFKQLFQNQRKKYYRLLVFLGLDYMLQLAGVGVPSIFLQQVLAQSCEFLITSVNFESFYKVKQVILADVLTIQRRESLMGGRFVQFGYTEFLNQTKPADGVVMMLNPDGTLEEVGVLPGQ